MGRPRKPAGKKKSEQVSIHLTKEIKEILNKMALEENRTVANVCEVIIMKSINEYKKIKKADTFHQDNTGSINLSEQEINEILSDSNDSEIIVLDQNDFK